MKRDSHHDLWPLLTPLHGGTDKKPRCLDKDVVALGRARGCDIMLDANDISAIHCLFYRAPSGLRVRDCGSRTGVRVNGTNVKNSPLVDGDIVQLGPFSFEVKIPASLRPGSQAIDPRQWEHAQRSRRNLARLALAWRGKWRRAGAGAGGLGDKAADLKAKIRSYDQRLSQLEASEVELVEEREQLARERDKHEQRVQQLENDLAKRLEQTERDIHAQWAEFQKRCADEELRVQSTVTYGEPPSQRDSEATAARRLELDARESQLAEREAAWTARDRQISQDYEEIERERHEIIKLKSRFEAEQTTRHAELEQHQAKLAQAENALREQKAELSRMFADLNNAQEELRKQPRVDHKALQQENQQLRQSVSALEQRIAQAIDRSKVEELLMEQEQVRRALTDEIKALGERLAQAELPATAPEASNGVEALRAENDELRRLLQGQLFKTSESSAADDELRIENQQLRQILTEYEERLAAADHAPSAPPDAEKLRDENELLRQLLQEKDKFLDEIRTMSSPESGALPVGVREQLESQAQELDRLRDEVMRLECQVRQEQSQKAPSRGSPSLDDIDLDSVEAELNQERRQLQAERAKLSKEIDALKARNAELDEATREMEMELSRERAAMARERARLDRLRDDIKTEMERLQRDGGVRESLASVQRLREQMKAAGVRR